MDSAKSAREVAQGLGTSAPRVIRAVDRLRLDVARTSGGRLRLLPRHVRKLEQELGVTPSISGLSRVEVGVLDALASSPFGLPSERAVALRAGVSPTTAGRAIERLITRGLVERKSQPVAMGGVRTVELIRVDVTASEWHTIAPRIGGAVTPELLPTRRQQRVPGRLAHLFWNTAPSQLDVGEHGGFIARRLLGIGDLEGLAWGEANLSSADWEHASQARGIPADRRALARNLAAASR